VARDPLVVGFDLDMTLADTRPGIAACWDAVAARTGVPIDSAAAVARLGPPLRVEAAEWFPPERVPEVVELYRSLYPAIAVAPSRLLPGAAHSFDAVRHHNGRILVVTSKQERLAKLHLDHLGLAPDVVVGDVFAEEKGEALRSHSATVYVGDHLGDVRAAKAAGALSVAVTTGPISAEDLRLAGADVVLPDLTSFPDWLTAYAQAR
jgi:phosphoglycolate phosphatase-like HAD superfamily hydrolase